MSDSNADTADRMKKGQGISKGFKVVGSNMKGDVDHPEMTGIDPRKRGPGRPSSKEDSFKVVGKTAEQENQSS